ncbi:hypothetical protein, partial [Serratia marcescens]|uniref:hypothetical protein n=1 Tax=Serratia marcescens TaxID=615 RepID=UPI0023802149
HFLCLLHNDEWRFLRDGRENSLIHFSAFNPFRVLIAALSNSLSFGVAIFMPFSYRAHMTQKRRQPFFKSSRG